MCIKNCVRHHPIDCVFYVNRVVDVAVGEISLAKSLDQVQGRLRLKHYSLHIESQGLRWMRRFILFNGKRHPRQGGAVATDAVVATRRFVGTFRHLSASPGQSGIFTG